MIPSNRGMLSALHHQRRSQHPLAVCASQHQVGTFKEGKEFDSLLFDVNIPGGPFDVTVYQINPTTDL